MASKGANKVGPAINFNVPDLPGASIEKQANGLVAAYRGSSEQVVEFCEHMRQWVLEFRPDDCKFDNIDVSQVEWNTVGISLLLDTLQGVGASTKRFKAFKAGLDDDSVRCLAQWLESLSPASLPDEVHLSNNQITREGFDRLLAVVEAKRSQLGRSALGSIRPMWMRVENNQVEASYLHELEKAGRIVLIASLGERQLGGSAAVAMPSFKKAAQAKGKAPSGKGSWWENGDESWGGSWTSHGWWEQDDQQDWWAEQSGRGSGGSSSRARNGASKRSGASAYEDWAPPAEWDIPEPWEQHWCYKYQIPYYWNRETGDALWEPPWA